VYSGDATTSHRSHNHFSRKESHAARETVSVLYEEAKSICQTKDTDQEKIEQLKKLVEEYWDAHKIAAYIMHPNWCKFSRDEKKKFLVNLKHKIVKIFFNISKKYINDFSIKKVSLVKGKKNAFDVHCEVKNKDDNRRANIRFQVVNKLVRNIYVETLSLVDAKKKEYADLFRSKNKKIPEFLEAISGHTRSSPTSKKHSST
jgi:ABC-type transporter MlaC component